MNVSSRNSENVMENITNLKENNQGKLWHVYSSNMWANSSKVHQAKSLAFLPILAFIIFVICSLLKAYKWSRDSARWKARGDVEFSDEGEVNYGIIKAGDKDFCQIDILSDGASVYDTVNSLRFLGNGYATQMSDSYPYHDTVTSYKSLLMQKAEVSPYDSVKSCKTCMQKVYQNKDLAVELQNSCPVHSKSIELSSALEGERFEIITRSTNTMLLKKQLSKDGQFLQFESKRSKCRRASGDISTAKKQSISQPFSHWVTNPVCSLPSVHHTFSFSGDSEEILQTFRVDRKTYASRKKKVQHSPSSGKIHTFPGSSCHSAPCTHSNNGTMSIPKRRRHFSADSMRHLKKITVNKMSHKYSHDDDLTSSFSTEADIKIMGTKPLSLQMAVSPEHPKTSVSLDIGAPLLSSSDLNITRKKHIPLSIVSNGHILESDVLVSLNSGAQLQSTSEMETSTKQSISETKISVLHAREKFFKNKLNSAFSSKPKDANSHHSGTVAGNKDFKNCPRANVVPANCHPISNSKSHSVGVEDRINFHLQCVHHPTFVSLSKNACVNSKKDLLSLRKQQNSEMVETNRENSINGVLEPATKCNLFKVQRFYVTYVNAKMSNLISDVTETN